MTLWTAPITPTRLIEYCLAPIGATVTLTFLACTSGEPDRLAGWQAPDLVWAGCEATQTEPPPEMQCATLPVPVDWSQPDGPSIELTVARFEVQDPTSNPGVVIVLSGGPGGSGIDDLPLVANGMPAVRNQFDLVAHEPRTAQALRTLPPSCMRSAGAIADLAQDSLAYARMLEPLVEAVQRCRADVESGLIDHLDGLSQALDVEAIRRALDVEQVNLTAQSYGGVVVAAYARTFPGRVRAAYVDGVASHPDYPFVRGPQTQRREFERFANWCEGEPECVLFGEDVVQLWLTLTEDANQSPIPAASDRFGEQHLSGAQMHFLTRRWRDPGPEYSRWYQLARDIDRARRGDASAFVDWAFGNLVGWAAPINVALQCPDGAEGQSGYRNFRARFDQYRQNNPVLYGVKLLGMVCEAWPGPLANPPTPLPGSELPPFLGAGTTENDFASTAQFLEHVPHSVAIAVSGSGHVVYLGGASESAQRCVLEHLSNYLTDLVLPPVGTECAM